MKNKEKKTKCIKCRYCGYHYWEMPRIKTRICYNCLAQFRGLSKKR